MNTLQLTEQLFNRDGSPQVAKIPTKEMVKGEDGEMHEETKLVESVVTLGDLLTHSCLRQNGDIAEESVVERYNLFLKLDKCEEIELSDEEIEMLKHLVLQSFDTFTAGAILTILNK